MERKQLQRSNSKMERWRVAARKVLFSLHDEQLPSGRLGRDAAPSRVGTGWRWGRWWRPYMVGRRAAAHPSRPVHRSVVGHWRLTFAHWPPPLQPLALVPPGSFTSPCPGHGVCLHECRNWAGPGRDRRCSSVVTRAPSSRGGVLQLMTALCRVCVCVRRAGRGGRRLSMF